MLMVVMRITYLLKVTDNDTTNRSVHGDSDSSSGNSSSSNSGNSSSNNSSSSQSSSGNALTRLFNLNAIFDNKAS